jgi:hypothetical protein
VTLHVVAPVITHLLPNATGPNTNHLALAGLPGNQYVLQFATNLTDSPWFNLATNVVGTNGQWLIEDPTATNWQRFYRVQP